MIEMTRVARDAETFKLLGMLTISKRFILAVSYFSNTEEEFDYWINIIFIASLIF